MNGFRWRPIEDLHDDWQELASNDLAAFSPIWTERKVRLADSQTLDQFNKKLVRQWAIETGIIEGLYSIDRGTTQLLIEKGIDASLIPHGHTDKPVSEVVPMIKDQEGVVEGLFDFVSQKRQLSTSYIKQIHQALADHQDYVDGLDTLGHPVQLKLRKGDWKVLENSPSRQNGTIHEYCPPEHVASEMDRLIAMHLEHCRLQVPPEVEAAWLHHRFTQVHPFQDGNGRVARSLASLVFIRAGWFPLVLVGKDHRTDYIEALELADKGNLSALINMFARIQKNAFIKALSISEDILTEKVSMDAMLKAISTKLKTREQIREERISEKQNVFDLSKNLEKHALERMSTFALELQGMFTANGLDASAEIDKTEKNTEHYFRKQIIHVANHFDYFADMGTYHSWIRLKLNEKRLTRVVFSFHALGVDFSGLLACSAFLEHREYGEDNEVKIDGPVVICNDIFQFAYNQELPVIIASFEKWFDQTLLNGMDQWRRGL